MPFPTIEVYYQPVEGDELPVEVASKPEGVLCIGCITTMETMWPRQTVEQHLEIITKNPDKAETIVQASDCRSGRAELNLVHPESVSGVVGAGG